MNARDTHRNLEALVDAARVKQPGAMDRLLAALQPFVIATANRLASNPADAEEVAQETLITVLRNLEHFAGRSGLHTWVFALVRSQIGRKYRRMRPLPESACGGAWTEPRDGHDEAAAWEVHDDLARALSGLSPLDRTIVLGRDLDGDSAETVADAVGLTVPALKSRLHRARLSVRHCLGSAASA